MLKEYWASTVIFIGIFSQCALILLSYLLISLKYNVHFFYRDN